MRIIAGSAKGRTIKIPKRKTIRPAQDRVRQAVFSMLYGLVENARVLDLFAGSGAYGLEALSRGAKHATFVDDDKTCTEIIKENLRAVGFGSRGVVIRSNARKFVENYIEHHSELIPNLEQQNPKFETLNPKQILSTKSQILNISDFGFRISNLFGASNLVFRILKKFKSSPKSKRLETKTPDDKNQFDLIFLDPPYSSDPQIHLLKLLARILAPQGVIIFEHAKETKLPEKINGLRLLRRRSYGATAVSLLSRRDTNNTLK